jgi:hypothetical protein
MMGDCGVLAIDHNTREVYGHIVANSQRRGIAFMVPFKPVFETLEREGGWELLTLHYSDALPTDSAQQTEGDYLLTTQYLPAP